MAVALNHIIIPSRDKVASSRFLTEILGIDPPRAVSHFMAVEVSNIAADVVHYADPSHLQPGEINHRNGGRGFYFDDPDGHNMEVFTRVPLP